MQKIPIKPTQVANFFMWLEKIQPQQNQQVIKFIKLAEQQQQFYFSIFVMDFFLLLILFSQAPQLQAKHLSLGRVSFSSSVIGLSRKKANETGEGVDCGYMTVVQSCILSMKPLEFLKQSFIKLYKIVSPHDSICYGHDATGPFQKNPKRES